MDPLLRYRIYDGSWWEAELPDGWSCRRDKSVKGWPILFESQSGSLLRVQTVSYDIHIPQQEIMQTCRNFSLERQKAEFTRLLGEPASAPVSTAVKGETFFEFKRYADRMQDERWFVQFSGGRWKIWAIFDAPEAVYAKDESAAVQILQSIAIEELHP